MTLHELGWSYGRIAAVVHCSKSTAKRTFERFTKTGKIAYKAKSGRPKLLSPREGCLIERKSLANHFMTAPALRAEFQEFIGRKVSVSTGKRLLNNSGLYGRVARRKPLLNDKHRRKCLNFTKLYQTWTSEDRNFNCSTVAVEPM